MRIRRARTRLLVSTGALLLGGMGVLAIAAPGQPQITQAPPAFTNDTSPTLAWSSGGNGSGVFDWKLSGPTEGSGTSGGSATPSGLADGGYTFSVTERPSPDDPDQSSSPAAEATFTVDTDAPDAATPSISAQGPASASGWFGIGDTPVNLSSSCQQGGSPVSGPTFSPAASIVSNFNGNATAACADLAGNSDTSPGSPVRVDVGAPTLGRTLSPANPVSNGWYRSAVQVTYQCADDLSGFAAGGCPANFSVTAQGVTDLPAAVAVDRADNASAPLPALQVRRDNAIPTLPIPGAPDGPTNQSRPTFTWLASIDATSGVIRYALTVNGRTHSVPVTAADTGEIAFQLPAADALTPGGHKWQVRAFDAAGNQSALTAERAFTFDPNIPDAPVITGGPRGFTRTTNPTFTFTGLVGAQFAWRLEDAAAGPLDPPLQAGDLSPEGSATLAPLPDGQYRFKVTQRNAAGSTSGAAVAAFTLDTTPPSAPRITGSPGTTGDGQPSFAWTGGEAGAAYRWRVNAAAGAAVLTGSVQTTSVRIPTPLSGGEYVFQVLQVDQAGNESAWSGPQAFTVVGPPSPPIAVPPSTTQPASPTTPTGSGTPRATTTVRRVPKTFRPKRLTPRAGAVVTTLRPTLRWTRVPKATLYNVQVFRWVPGRRGQKVVSAFPRGTRFVVPPGKLKKGQRYVWRVWPYYARLKRYSTTKHGESWFDVSRTARTRR